MEKRGSKPDLQKGTDPTSGADKEYDKYDLGNACSGTDCTGLMPTPPQNDAEMESYQDIYDYQATVVSEEDKKK